MMGMNMAIFRVRASRRAELGQHFLAGGWLAAELVEQAGVGPDDLVVEIGAGTGVLTEALAQRAGRWWPWNATHGWPSGPGRGWPTTATCGGDGRRAGHAAAAAAVPGGGQPAVRVTAAMLRRLLGDPRSRLERADLIVQEQAARRYAARRPGAAETIAWGAWYERWGWAGGSVRAASGRRRGSGRRCWWIRPAAAAGPGGWAPAVHPAGRGRLPPSRAAAAARAGPAPHLPPAAPAGPRPRLPAGRPARRPGRRPVGGAACVPQQHRRPGKCGSEPVG